LSVELFQGNIKFTQRRYPTNNGEIYAIPITFSVKAENDFTVTTPKIWMTTETLYVATSAANLNVGDWIVLNNQQVGYYRVDYSTELWHAIIKQLTENHEAIHPINRAILMDEIFMAWKDFGRVTAGDVLESLSYLYLEDEPIAWNRADKIFTELNSRLLGSHAHKPYRKFIQDLTKFHLERLGFEGIEGEPSYYMSLRNSVKKWSCTAWDENCLNNEYQKWLTFFTTSTAGASFDYCFALVNINADTFSEILTGITTNATYPSRNNYLRYLGCNQNEMNLQTLLMAAINTGNILSTQERVNLIRSVFQAGSKGTQAFFHFADVYFFELLTVSPTEFVNTLAQLATFTNTECSINTLMLLSSHVLEYELITKEERARVSNTYKSTAIPWNNRNYDVIESFFENYSSPVIAETTSTTTTTPMVSNLKFLIT
jgi:hypothetical protein